MIGSDLETAKKPAFFGAPGRSRAKGQAYRRKRNTGQPVGFDAPSRVFRTARFPAENEPRTEWAFKSFNDNGLRQSAAQKTENISHCNIFYIGSLAETRSLLRSRFSASGFAQTCLYLRVRPQKPGGRAKKKRPGVFA